MARKRKYWLMKSEPNAYSIDDLEKDEVAPWDGIRNYQARNFMRDEMKKGDLALFYHSNAKPPGVAGVMRVCRESYPDHTAWDEKSKYFDARSTPEKPVWEMVDLEFVEKFPHFVPLSELREKPQLADLMVLKRGMRLSIQPVTQKHFQMIRRIGRRTKS